MRTLEKGVLRNAEGVFARSLIKMHAQEEEEGMMGGGRGEGRIGGK